jgi:hypothetical protein
MRLVPLGTTVDYLSAYVETDNSAFVAAVYKQISLGVILVVYIDKSDATSSCQRGEGGIHLVKRIGYTGYVIARIVALKLGIR